MSNKKLKSEDDLNEDYFKSFVNTRGSIGMLSVSAVSVLLLGIETAFTWDIFKYRGLEPKENIFIIFLCISLIIEMFSFIISFLPSITYRLQRFCSIMYLFFTIILCFSLDYAGYLFIAAPTGDSEQVFFTSKSAILYMILVPIIYMLSLIYNYFWLRRELRRGFSSERTSANYEAMNVYSTGSLGIIFVSSMMFSYLADNSFANTIYLLIGIFFAIIFSRLTIEVGYSVYLRFKDKKYWEGMPEKEVRSKKENRLVIYKRIKYTYLALSIIYFIYLTFAYDMGGEPRILILISRVVRISWLVMLTVWLIKKIFTKINK
ncbi:hypothetical protein [Floricoccus penangensis]|uniref:hypothetical protein n=1 Tax=Floricoccus penangensis TaxID=1859475 RepID=UPI0020419E48|nr:hypothetical protein [Floricoccus penangensis]URZ88138.1 hypothetical protein KIW23_03645 [Floricoccus penangensis]